MEVVGSQVGGKRIFQCHRSVGVILDDRIGPYLLRILHHGGIIGEKGRIELDDVMVGLEVHDLVLSRTGTEDEGVAAAIAVKDVIPRAGDQYVVAGIADQEIIFRIGGESDGSGRIPVPSRKWFEPDPYRSPVHCRSN